MVIVLLVFVFEIDVLEFKLLIVLEN